MHECLLRVMHECHLRVMHEGLWRLLREDNEYLLIDINKNPCMGDNKDHAWDMKIGRKGVFNTIYYYLQKSIYICEHQYEDTRLNLLPPFLPRLNCTPILKSKKPLHPVATLMPVPDTPL